MNELNEMIAQERANWNRLSGQKEAQTRERMASLSIEARRQTILGGIDTDCFLWLLRLQPQATEAENQAEFAPWAYFLALLKDDEEYVNRLMEKVFEAFPEVKDG